MGGIVYYLVTAAIFFFTYCIFSWGLNLQFGITGILNFAFIAFVAIGAYIAGVAALTPSTANGLTGQYILGLNLPFPIPLMLGGIAAGILGALVGVVALRRLRSDYLAIVTVSVSQILWFVIGNNTPLFNGWDGITGVPQPWNSVFKLNFNDYNFVFLGICAAFAALGYIVIQRLQNSPYGRVLRIIREDEDVAAALGKNIFRYKMSAFIIGCIYAGVGGALSIELIGAWNPSGWLTMETFVIWAAMLVGGKGNNMGMVLGAFVVPVVFNEVTRFIPQIPSHPQLIDSIRMMAIGLLMILICRFRPDGILPEKKVIYDISRIKDKPEVKVQHVQ